MKLTETDFQLDVHPVKHTVITGLEMLHAVGKTWNSDNLELWSDEKDVQFVKDLFVKAGIGEDSLKVVIFLSTTAANKDWDVQNYAQIARELQGRYGAEIIILGAKSDTESKGKEFMEMVSNVHNFIGKTTIRQTYEILCQSDLYIGGDTGTMHLAAASKIPGVVITKDYEGAVGDKMGALIDRFYPWKSPIRIIRPEAPLSGGEKECKKNFAHCINQISPDIVLKELYDVIKQNIRNKWHML